MTDAQKKEPRTAPGVKKLDWPVLLLNGLTFLAFAAAIAALLPAAGLADKAAWVDAALLLILTAGTANTLARQLPWQNVLLVVAVIGLLGGGLHAAGARTDLPFGPFFFGKNAGEKMFGTLPWIMPFLWIVIVLNARGVARLVLRPWRKAKTYGYRLIALTSVLTALFDFAFDPFATCTKQFWGWAPTKLPLTWQNAPIVNFLVWGAAAALLLAFTTPALIRKQPGQKSGPDYHPLGVWLGAMALFATGAALGNLWLVVGVDAAIGIVTAIFAIRGALW